MTTPRASNVRRYDVHGVALEVRSSEPVVIEAMDLRLRGFRAAKETPGRGGGAAEVRLEFLLDRASEFAPPPGTGRAVYETPRGTLDYFPDDDVLFGRFGNVRIFCAPRAGLASFFSPSYAGPDLYLACHPLATVCLMELLERRGLYSLHAACLADGDGRGVLLAGPSGAGKSTLTLALTQAGMSCLSDDVVFLALDRGAAPVRAMGFADAIGVSDHARRCLPELAARAPRLPVPGFPKPLARIEELVARPAISSCRPVSLVFPRVAGDRRSRILPLDHAEALLQLVPDILATHAASTQAHLESIGALLDQTRCYTLDSGGDLDQAVELILNLTSDRGAEGYDPGAESYDNPERAVTRHPAPSVESAV